MLSDSLLLRFSGVKDACCLEGHCVARSPEAAFTKDIGAVAVLLPALWKLLPIFQSCLACIMLPAQIISESTDQLTTERNIDDTTTTNSNSPSGKHFEMSFHTGVEAPQTQPKTVSPPSRDNSSTGNKSTAENSILDILRYRIHNGPSLLDSIPLEDVQLVPQNEVPGSMPFMLVLGSIPDSTTQRALQLEGIQAVANNEASQIPVTMQHLTLVACLSSKHLTDTTTKKLPRVFFAAYGPRGLPYYTPYSAQDVIDSADLQPVFQHAKTNPNTLASFLKFVFLEKGAAIPAVSDVKESIIRHLAQACRAYKAATLEAGSKSTPMSAAPTQQAEQLPSPSIAYTEPLEIEERAHVRSRSVLDPHGQAKAREQAFVELRETTIPGPAVLRIPDSKKSAKRALDEYVEVQLYQQGLKNELILINGNADDIENQCRAEETRLILDQEAEIKTLLARQAEEVQQMKALQEKEAQERTARKFGLLRARHNVNQKIKQMQEKPSKEELWTWIDMLIQERPAKRSKMGHDESGELEK
jgi:hypothetical protein